GAFEGAGGRGNAICLSGEVAGASQNVSDIFPPYGRASYRAGSRGRPGRKHHAQRPARQRRSPIRLARRTYGGAREDEVLGQRLDDRANGGGNAVARAFRLLAGQLPDGHGVLPLRDSDAALMSPVEVAPARQNTN